MKASLIFYNVIEHIFLCVRAHFIYFFFFYQWAFVTFVVNEVINRVFLTAVLV
jgi:hypothetical protein